MAETFKIEELEEKVILVGVSEQEGDDAEDSVAELAELVNTAVPWLSEPSFKSASSFIRAPMWEPERLRKSQN